MTYATDLHDPLTRRRRLGSDLRLVRNLAGMSTRDLAIGTGLSQTTVVRIEAGTSHRLSIPVVESWLDATHVHDAAKRIRLIAATTEAVTEIHRLQDLLARQPHIQNDIGFRESTATRIRYFQPSIIPGLLQTRAYATRVMEMFDRYTPDALNEAVDARAARQSRLGEPGRRFDFLVTEAALRWQPGPADLLKHQLNHIIHRVRLDGVSVAVIPTGESTTTIPHGFTVYDTDDEHTGPGRYVDIETMHATIDVTDPEDVDVYVGHWRQLKKMALTGTDALNFVNVIADDLN